jgi:hypothetical protein
VVNTEAEQTDIQALRCDLDSASLCINVSFLRLFKITACLLILTLFFVQKIIEHSQSKEKFLRASLRRISEAQNFEDEMEWVRAMNEMLLTQNEELVAQLDAERWEKIGMLLMNFFFCDRAWVRLWTNSIFVAAVEQHITLGVKLDDQNSVANTIAALKNDLADKKWAHEKFQMDTETLSRAVEELKKAMD